MNPQVVASVCSSAVLPLYGNGIVKCETPAQRQFLKRLLRRKRRRMVKAATRSTHREENGVLCELDFETEHPDGVCLYYFSDDTCPFCGRPSVRSVSPAAPPPFWSF